MEKINKRISNIFLIYSEERIRLSDSEKERIGYSIQSILSELEKILLFGFVFLLMGRFADFVIIYLALFIVRGFIGGIHQKTFITCLLHTSIFFIIVIFMTDQMILPGSVWIYILFFSSIDILLAPEPSLQRGTYGKKAKFRMKAFAVVGLIIMGIVAEVTKSDNLVKVLLIVIHADFISAVIKNTRRR